MTTHSSLPYVGKTEIIIGLIIVLAINMVIVYKKYKNILYAILIHQMVNFTLDILYTGDLLDIFIPISVLYFMTAVAVCILYPEKQGSERI